MRHAGVATRSVILTNRTAAALLGGLAGGLAFGLLMQVTDIVLMVAALVGRDSASVGWVVHMSIALLFGLLYAMLARQYADSLGSGTIAGVLYGWAWWILGGLIIMPAWLGRTDLILQFSSTAWQSLAGHLIYGFLLGSVCAATVSRLDWRARTRHAGERTGPMPAGLRPAGPARHLESTPHT